MSGNNREAEKGCCCEYETVVKSGQGGVGGDDEAESAKNVLRNLPYSEPQLSSKLC